MKRRNEYIQTHCIMGYWPLLVYVVINESIEKVGGQNTRNNRYGNLSKQPNVIATTSQAGR